jgi:hypothetical protein
LIGKFREQKNYSLLFEARLMKRRAELGLPLIQTDSASSFPLDKQREYEQTVMEAAREAGQLFLGEGNIERAWPYFRAIGEPAPIVEAIEQYEPGEGEEIEPVVDIAYQQGLNPRKGLALILKKHGMCRAITCFGMYGVASGREECMGMLIRALYKELVGNVKFAIEREEGAPPETDSLVDLIASREWLFGEYDYYVDTSHLSSVIQYCPDVESVEVLRLIRELCAYGKRLSTSFRVMGHPPFQDIYIDYDLYAAALLGDDVEAVIAHFRRKVEEDEPGETLSAQALVQLLVRLGRLEEALEVSQERLAHKPPSELGCPSTMQLCRMAGNYGKLMSFAKERGDILSYAAGALESKHPLASEK